MKLNNLSAKKICRLISAGMVFSMLVITGILGGIMQDIRIFIAGGTLTLCAFFWIWLLVLSFGKRLSHFTSNLCRTLDNMIDGNEELQKSNDSETLFARINHRLIRLYEIMQENRLFVRRNDRCNVVLLDQCQYIAYEQHYTHLDKETSVSLEVRRCIIQIADGTV